MKQALSILAAIASATALSAAVTSTTGNVITYTGGLSEANRITEDTIWTSDNVYVLDKTVYVSDGATLTIEPGTLVKAEDGTLSNVSALVISRGSKIYALGTPSEPIIFTSVDDTLDGNLTKDDKGLWGGVVILGDGLLNSDKAKKGQTYPNITDNVEGIVANDYTIFGGTSNDNSQGIFRYVSIRHGGMTLDPDNELNGLTLGAVTDKTVIEFVEIFANSDDSIEIFGGNVNPRFIVSAFPGDDGFDWDSGWEGYGQFWAVIGDKGNPTGDLDHGAEMDGIVFNGSNLVAEQRGMGEIYNATYIGPGKASGVNEGLFEISDDAGVRYYNSIFMDFGATDHVIDIKANSVAGLTEVLDGDTAPRIDIRNNIFYNFNVGDDLADFVHINGTSTTTGAGASAIIFDAAKGNKVEDPKLRGVSRTNDGGLDLRPAADSPAFTNARSSYPADPFFINANYQGAFGESNWMLGWTKLSKDGFTGEQTVRTDNTIYNTAVRTSLDIAAGEIVAVGVVITGDAPRMVMIRAEGAGLADNGVTNPASATALQIYKDGVLFNDGKIWTNWAESDEAPAINMMSEYVGFGTIDNDTTSGIALLSLNPGSYSVAITNPDGTGGEALISVTIIDR